MKVLSDGGIALNDDDRERVRLDALLANAREASLRERQDLKLHYNTPWEFEEDINLGKQWVFKNLIALGETSAWIAPPGGMKSSLMAEMSVCAALGRDWHGSKCTARFAVFYFALERADLVKRRILAHCKQLGLSEDELRKLHIAVCSATIDLTNASSVKDVVAVVKNFEFSFDDDDDSWVAILIFDTFAKLIAAGGGDEDKAAWQGKVFANVQTIKNRLGGPHVALVGHTGKDESRGARGSNAFLGDADVMVQIGGDHVKTATIVKANDRPDGIAFSFTGVVHEFGKDEDGDPITVNIVSAEEVTAPQRQAKEPRLSANQQAMFAILHAAGSTGLTTDEWYEATRREAGIGVDRRATLVNIRHALKSKNLVREYADRWTVNHD